MSWGDLSDVAMKVATMVEGAKNIQVAFYKFVMKPKDAKDTEKNVLAEVSAAFPGLISTLLAAMLKVDEAEINKAEAAEVMRALEVCLRVMRYDELLAEGKKLKALLG